METNDNFISKSKDEVINDNIKMFREQKHNNASQFGTVVNSPIDLLMDEVIDAPKKFTESQRMQIIEMFCKSKEMTGYYNTFGFYVNDEKTIKIKDLISSIEVPTTLLEKCVSNSDVFTKAEKKDIVKKVGSLMKLRGTDFCLRMSIEDQIEFAKKDMVQFIRNNVEIYDSLGDIQFEKDDIITRRLDRARKRAEPLCVNLEKIDSIKYGEPEWFNLRNVISEVLYDDIANDYTGNSFIHPYFYFEDGSVEVYMEKNGFQTHVLRNIIDNFKKHAFCDWDDFNKKKLVGVWCESGEDKILLDFLNNGNPFEGDVNYVFEYGKGDGKGDGIGLYSAKRFLDNYDAKIEMLPRDVVVNEYDGVAEVVFRITIPKKEK